jgi:hypothetical protein
MGKTLRWWNKPKNKARLNMLRAAFIHPWKVINPFFFRHERKEVRVELHRGSRHSNRIRVKKGMDIEKERKTNGWETH